MQPMRTCGDFTGYDYDLPVEYVGSDEASGGGEIAIIISAAVVLVASVPGFVIWKKRKMSGEKFIIKLKCLERT